MQLHNQNRRKTLSIVAAAAASVAAAVSLCAPASFGSSKLRAAFWDTEPIIFAVPTTVEPNSTANCGVAFSDASQNSPAVTTAKHVTVYSDPPGAISYSGTVTGSSATLPTHVSSTASGPVTVYVETDGSAPVSAQTTVVGG